MKNLIRAGLIVALGLGVNVLCADAWADEDPSAVTETGDKGNTIAEAQTEPPPEESKAGAGSLEPAEEVEEDGGAGAHKAWVESIWSTP
jgi:hypothetical protein